MLHSILGDNMIYDLNYLYYNQNMISKASGVYFFYSKKYNRLLYIGSSSNIYYRFKTYLNLKHKNFNWNLRLHIIHNPIDILVSFFIRDDYLSFEKYCLNRFYTNYNKFDIKTRFQKGKNGLISTIDSNCIKENFKHGSRPSDKSKKIQSDQLKYFIGDEVSKNISTRLDDYI